jgi:hypothetical protein
MAYPFRPLKGRKIWKLAREREDSDQAGPDSNRCVEFESPVADPHQNKISLLPAVTTKITTENIFSKP